MEVPGTADQPAVGGNTDLPFATTSSITNGWMRISRLRRRDPASAPRHFQLGIPWVTHHDHAAIAGTASNTSENDVLQSLM